MQTKEIVVCFGRCCCVVMIEENRDLGWRRWVYIYSCGRQDRDIGSCSYNDPFQLNSCAWSPISFGESLSQAREEYSHAIPSSASKKLMNGIRATLPQLAGGHGTLPKATHKKVAKERPQVPSNSTGPAGLSRGSGSCACPSRYRYLKPAR